MDTNKILSADLLDLIFDDRNKEYGAYDLRRNYHIRITKSLVFTGVFITLIFTGVVLANKLDPEKKSRFSIRDSVILKTLPPDEKEPDPIPPKRTEPPQVRTEQLTTDIRIEPDTEVPDTPPTQDDLDSAQIGVSKIVGVADVGIPISQTLTDGTGKGLLEEKTTKEPDGPFERVEIDAKFDGNWEKFLLRNLNPQTPIDNDAPVGMYTVVIQFVVDLDGTVSDLRALTNHGYGLEQEAIRVLKKAKTWEPAIQNGRKVKAYRKQPITFQVTEE